MPVFRVDVSPICYIIQMFHPVRPATTDLTEKDRADHVELSPTHQTRSNGCITMHPAKYFSQQKGTHL